MWSSEFPASVAGQTDLGSPSLCLSNADRTQVGCHAHFTFVWAPRLWTLDAHACIAGAQPIEPSPLPARIFSRDCIQPCFHVALTSQQPNKDNIYGTGQLPGRRSHPRTRGTRKKEGEWGWTSAMHPYFLIFPGLKSAKIASTLLKPCNFCHRCCCCWVLECSGVISSRVCYVSVQCNSVSFGFGSEDDEYTLPCSSGFFGNITVRCQHSGWQVTKEYCVLSQLAELEKVTPF